MSQKKLDLNYDKKQILSIKLNQYGLDPFKWSIMEQPKRKGEYLISSITEENFTFIGLAEEKNKSWDWRFIELKSV